MKMQLLLVFLISISAGGCAGTGSSTHGNGSSKDGMTQSIGDDGAFNALTSGCRVPCSISPGSGCC